MGIVINLGGILPVMAEFLGVFSGNFSVYYLKVINETPLRKRAHACSKLAFGHIFGRFFNAIELAPRGPTFQTMNQVGTLLK